MDNPQLATSRDLQRLRQVGEWTVDWGWGLGVGWGRVGWGGVDSRLGLGLGLGWGGVGWGGDRCGMGTMGSAAGVYA